MIKNFRFAGVALLAVGLTFAASSCQKQDFIENQDENQLVTIDLDELTKAPVADVAEATANVDAALEDIFSSMAKVPTLEEGEVAELKELKSAIFSHFNGEYVLDIKKEYFSSFLKVTAVIENGTYDVRVVYTDGGFKIQTPQGYFITVKLPDAVAQITNHKASGDIAGSLTFTIGKGSAKYAEVEFNIFDESAIYTRLYDKQGNDVAGTNLGYSHKTYKIRTFEFWYNNIASAGEINYTDFIILDIPEVLNALKDMAFGWTYTKAEAEEIAASFNNYFINNNKDNYAQIMGKKFFADPVYYKSVSEGEVYRVCLFWGDSVVDAKDIYNFLKEYFSKIIEE